MLYDIFLDNDIIITEKIAEKLNDYYRLIIEYNKSVNLTAITDYNEVIYKHFLDSAYILSDRVGLSDNLSYDKTYINDIIKDDYVKHTERLSANSNVRLIDIGTGAGFPGVVISLLRPEWEVVLLDSLNKRVTFLNMVIDKLGLENATAIHGRAEELAREDNHRCKYNIVTSRAVADLRLLLELCVPFISDDGVFISYKGRNYKSELDTSEHAMKELSCELVWTYDYSILNEERELLLFERTSPLSDKYPRRAGIPAKRPL